MIFHINDQTLCVSFYSAPHLWLAVCVGGLRDSLGILCLASGEVTLGWGHEEWPQTSSTECSLKNYYVPGSATAGNKMNELSACMEPIGQQATKYTHSLTQGTQSKSECKM